MRENLACGMLRGIKLREIRMIVIGRSIVMRGELPEAANRKAVFPP